MTAIDALNVAADIGQAMAAIVALIGIPLAVRQLSLQNKQSQLTGLTTLEEMWSTRKERANERMGNNCNSSHDTLHEATVRRASELLRAQRTAVAADLSEIQDLMPGLILAILPRLDDAYRELGFIKPPRTEREYSKALMWRCARVFPILDSLAEDADEDVRQDLRKILQISNPFATVLNEMAEFFEFDLVAPDQFMQKRHITIIREVHIIEPVLLWQAARTTEHRSARTLRVLALAASARALTWSSTLHKNSTVILGSTRVGDQRIATMPYAPIIATASPLRGLPRRLRIALVRRRFTKPLRDSEKLPQNRTIDLVS